MKSSRRATQMIVFLKTIISSSSVDQLGKCFFSVFSVVDENERVTLVKRAFSQPRRKILRWNLEFKIIIFSLRNILNAEYSISGIFWNGNILLFPCGDTSPGAHILPSPCIDGIMLFLCCLLVQKSPDNGLCFSVIPAARSEKRLHTR